jgi:hypothetical protein
MYIMSNNIDYSCRHAQALLLVVAKSITAFPVPG